MTFIRTNSKLITLCFLIYISIGNAQEGKENTITYAAPSKNFVDITIQSHKGLPRFGDIYYHRGVTPPTNKDAYEALIKMKFLKEIFDDMDPNKLTKSNLGNAAEDQKIRNSKFAQDHLLFTLRLLSSEEVLKKHFCDTSTNPDCKFENTYGERTKPRYWGGSRNNEFQQMRSYKAYVNEYYSELKSWSTTFFKKDQEVVYLATRSGILGSYDFKNKGYWIGSMGSGSGFMLHSSNFLAYTENEKKLKNYSQKIFWEVDQAKAKELELRDRVPIIAVYKVKVLAKVRNTAHVEFNFELEDQLIELYRRPDLKNKIGEIDINNLITAY